MSIAIRYHSRGGNTKKLAEAVSKALGVPAKDLSASLSEKADVLFLGSSLYAGSFDPAVREFLKKHASSIGAVVCFGSSASGRSTYAKVKALAEELNLTVYPEFFNCPGHFLFLHKKRPNEEDLKALTRFAQTARNQLKA